MDTQRYLRATETSDEILQERLRTIRQAQDSGRITTRLAADLRVTAMVGHLEACREARHQFLEGAP